MLCAVFCKVTSISAFSLHVSSEYLQHSPSKTSYLLALFWYSFFSQAFNSDEGVGGRGEENRCIRKRRALVNIAVTWSKGGGVSYQWELNRDKIVKISMDWECTARGKGLIPTLMLLKG